VFDPGAEDHTGPTEGDRGRVVRPRTAGPGPASPHVRGAGRAVRPASGYRAGVIAVRASSDEHR